LSRLLHNRGCPSTENEFLALIYEPISHFLDVYIERLRRSGLKLDTAIGNDDLIQEVMKKAIPGVYKDGNYFPTVYNLANYLKAILIKRLYSKPRKSFSFLNLEPIDLARLFASSEPNDDWIEGFCPGFRKKFDSYHDELAKKAVILISEGYDNQMELVRILISTGDIVIPLKYSCNDLSTCEKEDRCSKPEDCLHFFNFCRRMVYQLNFRIARLCKYVIILCRQQFIPVSDL
jgi:hypothetical protein